MRTYPQDPPSSVRLKEPLPALLASFLSFILSFGKIGFGTSFNSTKLQIWLLFKEHPFNRFFGWPLGLTAELDKAIAVINDFAYSHIRERREAAKNGERSGKRKDLLDLFMELQNDDGSLATDAELRDMLLNMILAGRGTTACALSWAVFSICTRPAIVDNMRKEIERITGGAVPTFSQINDLKYINAVFNETLHLFPSVPDDSKYSVVPGVLPGGIPIPANPEVVWSLYAMGRHPSLWGPTAAEFDPERWLQRTDDESYGLVRESPYKWPVFNAGPRACLGQQMTTFEAIAVLAAVVQRFEVILYDFQ
ncbi:cytochrome P450 [Zopfochytrium polystomum]|nr:cytochrome P450 [Zopfochytrium polystomum]